MDVLRQMSPHGLKAYCGAGVAAMLVVLVVTAAQGGGLLMALLTTVAGFLLVGVATSSVHEVHRHQLVTRHLSIRADIAAAGGLGKRLMV